MYTNVWSDTNPTGAEAANTIDDIFRSKTVDIEQRIIDIFAMPNMTADPLRPYGLKFTDAQDAKIYLGDNAGTPRSLLIRNKADSTTYLTINSTTVTSTVPITTTGNPALTVSYTTPAILLINTTTGAVTDQTYISFARGGTSKWIIGNNIIGGNDDSFAIVSQGVGNAIYFNKATLAVSMNANLSIATGGLSVISGTTAVQALTATTGAFTSTLNTAASATIGWSSRSFMVSDVDGNIRLIDNSGTTFTRLQFGGTTASYPGITRSGANLLFTLADGSTFTGITASTGVFTGAISSSVGGIAIKLVATANGTYGSSEAVDWYRSDGTTLRTRVGYGSNNDQSFVISIQETGGAFVLQTGAAVTALTILSTQVATFASTVTATRLIASADISLAIAKATFGDGTTVLVSTHHSDEAANTLSLLTSQSNATASGTVIGTLLTINQTVATSGTIFGARTYAFVTHTSGTLAQLTGHNAGVVVSGNGGTVTTVRILDTSATIETGVTITSLRQVNIGTFLSFGTVTTAHGLYIDKQNVGTTPWTIYCASDTVTGSITFRDTALATNATIGFVFLPSGAGPPSGTPSPLPTGQVAWYYDSTNDKIYIFRGAAWRGVSVT